MKKKLLLLPLMMLVLSSCSLFGSPSPSPSQSDPTSSDPTSSDPSDSGTSSSDPCDSSDSTSSHPSSSDDVVEYTVTFDLNYPDAVGAPNPQSIPKYGLVSKPNDPVRDDYTFVHWFEGIDSTVAWDFDNTGVTKDMTLRAEWLYNYIDPIPTPKTFYVRAPDYWLEDSHVVALYAWVDGSVGPESNSAWPGEMMTHVSGQIYTYDVEVKFTHIVFARVTSTGDEPAIGSKAQTIDLDVAATNNPYVDFFWINDDVRYDDDLCYGRWGVYPDEPDDGPPPVTKTFYVRAPSYWLADNHVVAIHAFNDVTNENNLPWPGDRMAHVSGQIYSYEVEDKFTHIVFARVNPVGDEPTDGTRAQTYDLDITNLASPDYDFYWINDDIRYEDDKCQGLWGIYPDEPTPPTPTPGTVYYVQIPTYWTIDGGVAGIHMWDGNNHSPVGWPGQIMNHVDDRLYSFEVPGDYDNFMFVRVSPNGEDWGAKTIDLSKSMAGTHNLYTINEAVVWGDPGCEGVWSTYTV